MADGTKIEWTDATWNPITGCTVVSPGCTNCYAMKLAGTRMKHHPSRAGLTVDTRAGPVWNGDVRFNDQWLRQPLQWRKPREIFVNAHGDTFHGMVENDWIDQIFAVAALAPQHIFQVLTKRSARMLAYLTDPQTPGRIAAHMAALSGRSGIVQWPLPNVWLGVSVEDQRSAAERIPHLLDTPAAIRWLSCEPLLGPVDLRQIALPDDPACTSTNLLLDALTGYHTGSTPGIGTHARASLPAIRPAIDWVVVGGESDKGRAARPMHPSWAEALAHQCTATGTAFLFKQWGDWGPETEARGAPLSNTEGAILYANGWSISPPGQQHGEVRHYGKAVAGRQLLGRYWDDRPKYERDAAF